MLISTRPSVLTVLLEYIDLFNLSGNIKQTSITLTEETPFNALLRYITHTNNQHSRSRANNNYAVIRRNKRKAHFHLLCWHYA